MKKTISLLLAAVLVLSLLPATALAASEAYGQENMCEKKTDYHWPIPQK